jgi:pimeloyl-ACP methyl ester carboxylesterase
MMIIDQISTIEPGWLSAGGLLTYYEVQGSGDPMVILHGGFATVNTFSEFTPLLSEQYRTYSPERRGHGRMPDPSGPITHEIMADDTIAFIDALGVGPVHLVGWSDGGNVAMIVALRRPDLVRKLVVIGTAVNISGGTPIAQAMSSQMTVEHLPPALIEAYGDLSPDGADHFPIVFAKLRRALIDTTLQLDDLAQIPAPTLVMAADADLVSIAHLEAMRDAFPRAQLAIVPGTSHGLPLERPALVAQLILAFLADEPVTQLMPTRVRA